MASQSWIDKDFYEVLGVPRTASADEIKKRYRKLALEHHPDRSGGSDERFKEIGEAYDVLKDAEKRPEYDKLRDAIASGAGRGFPGGGFRAQDFGFGEEFDIEDLLNAMFGGGRGGGFGADFFGRSRGPVARRGSDVEAEVEVSFEESINGAERRLRFDLGGDQRDFTVKIPPGVSDGQRVRVRGRGGKGSPGAESGDVYVRVRVAPHPFFGRRGHDLTLTLPVTYPEAALGANVKVPTLNGAVTLKIPAGTSSGRTFRIRGKGVPKGRSDGRGDLLATVQVAVPAKLEKEERELVERLSSLENGSPRTHLGVSNDG